MRCDVLVALTACCCCFGCLAATLLPEADMEGHLAAIASKHNGHDCSTPSSTTLRSLCVVMKAQDKAS